jgi:hypothetical protein
MKFELGDGESFLRHWEMDPDLSGLSPLIKKGRTWESPYPIATDLGKSISQTRRTWKVDLPNLKKNTIFIGENKSNDRLT